MPNNKVKSTKQLKGKVRSGTLHPLSRRAKQVERINLRSDRIAKQKGDRTKMLSPKLDRALYFVHRMEPGSESCTLEDISLFLSEYLSRHDEEIAQEAKERRKGRPKSARHQKLDEMKEIEEKEAAEGLSLPDLRDPEMVKKFRKWADELGGDSNFLPHLKFITISTKQTGVIDDVTMADS